MRSVAFLRGVSPQNLRMADLRACLEEAGSTEVRTLLSSGNVAFTTRAGAVSALERRLAQEIENAFGLTLRSVEQLRRLVDDDPFGEFQVPAGAKHARSRIGSWRWRAAKSRWGATGPRQRAGTRLPHVPSRACTLPS
jgi:uncharacterized protein (DUF1697 family)